MPHRGSRELQYAVLASLLLHGLLFVWFPHLRDALRRGTTEPAPLVARLVEVPAPPAPATPEAAPPAPVAKPKPPPKPAPSPKARPSAVPAPPPVEPAAPASPAQPASESALGAAAPPQAAPARQGADAPDADTLARFRLQIIEAAARWKRYPRIATENNWEGRVDVLITFNTEGRRASIAVARTSGYEVLDQQAIDMVTKGFVPVPPSLRGREFTLDIPVLYSLKDFQ